MSGPAGQWDAQTPRLKDVSKAVNSIQLGDTCGRRRSCEGSGNNLKAMDDLILCGWCRDGNVRMAEFNCVRDNLAFGVRIDKFEAAVWLTGPMYKPFLAQKSQDRQVAGLAYMRMQHPTGPSGILLKSKGP
jgi:hypothetical protein